MIESQVYRCIVTATTTTSNTVTLLRAAPHTPHSVFARHLIHSQNVNMLTFNVLCCFSKYTNTRTLVRSHSVRSHIFFLLYLSFQFKLTFRIYMYINGLSLYWKLSAHKNVYIFVYILHYLHMYAIHMIGIGIEIVDIVTRKCVWLAVFFYHFVFFFFCSFFSLLLFHSFFQLFSTSI